MIGNDIVDLHLAKKESNWKRKGFLHKIFTPKEQKLILESENSENAIWNLWSRKEAAYKIYNRSTHFRAFNPTKFECFDVYTNKNETLGIVKIGYNIVTTKTVVTSDYVNSIAFIDENQEYKNEIFNIEQYQSLLKEKKIVKNQFGIPCFNNQNNLRPLLVSISHHGRYCSYISTI